MTAAEIGVIGGTGFYSFIEDAEEQVVPTPYGEPSASVALGTVAGRRVAFLPRHGAHHDFPPHGINYRANLWALRSLGVRQVLAPCAVGGLRPEGEAGVGQEEVFALFRANLQRLTGLLTDAVAALPSPDGCTCSTWADGLALTYRVP